MKVYLVRHAEPELQKTDPGLSQYGRQQAFHLAEILQTKNISIPFIYHSEKLRARETAEIIAGFIKPKPLLKEKIGIAPDSNPAIIAAELNTLKKDIMIVSHLPFLPALVCELTKYHQNKTSFEFGLTSCLCLVQKDEYWVIEHYIN